MKTRTSPLLAGLLVAGTALAPITLDATAASGADGRAAPTCHGKRATIVGHDPGRKRLITGTRGDDVIVGTMGPDIIHARGGDDVVCALSDKDVLFGGPGDDRLYGGHDRTKYRDYSGEHIAKGDTINGGPGRDLIDLGFDPGQELATHVAQRDTVSYAGAPHGVHLDLQAGRARGMGHDVVVDHPGYVWFETTDHDDRVIGTSGDDVGELGRGDDVFRGLAGDDRVGDDSAGGTGTDRLFGGAGDDELATEDGDDVLRGGGGDDWLIENQRPVDGPTSGAERWDLDGGPGDDRMSLWWVGDGGRISGGDGNDVLDAIFTWSDVDGGAGVDLAAGTLTQGGRVTRIGPFESFMFNAFAPLVLHGSDGPDRVGYAAPGLTADLGGGDDLLTVHPEWSDFARDDGSDDTVDGGPGTDTVDVGEGDDTCTDVEAGPC